MRTRLASFIGILSVTIIVSILCVQVHAQGGQLHILLPTQCDTILDLDTSASWPQVSERVRAHGGDTAVYEGFRLLDVLRTACPTLATMDKKVLAATVLMMEADDGYKAAYAWAELDTAYRAHPLMIALRKDGQTLDAHDGPLQLIMPTDQRHVRWVRQVRTVRIIRP